VTCLDHENSVEVRVLDDFISRMNLKTKQLRMWHLCGIFSIVRARQGYVECTGSDDKTSKLGGHYETTLVARILYQMDARRAGYPND
jgi:hypothetical protein